ncbi:MAG: hypothetical protein M3357_00865, partial [Actinomycetota bacterium]|nr:hypothetical protein [Actinomycetota bacterium]
HYTAAGVSMTPPVQSPTIPVWVGADSRHRAPRRRAARWDGFIPASDHWPAGVIPPEDYKVAVAAIRSRGIIHPLFTSGEDRPHPGRTSQEPHSDAGSRYP